MYFYFTDHLGSTTYITDREEVSQYVAYTPYGETFKEYRNVTPYKFNGKELDQETGYYYYGARYYDPGTALWFGPDPLTGKYPMYSPYVYCNANPVRYVDPDGMETKTLFKNQYENTVANQYPEDSNAKILFAHGVSNGKGIVDNRGSNKKVVDTGAKLKGIVDAEFSQSNNGEPNATTILISCNAANKENGIAQDLSIEMPEETVIGATDKVMQKGGEVKVINDGDWLILKNGLEVDRYDGNWQPKSKPTKLDYLLYNKRDSFSKRIQNIIKGNK